MSITSTVCIYKLSVYLICDAAKFALLLDKAGGQLRVDSYLALLVAVGCNLAPPLDDHLGVRGTGGGEGY